MTEHMIRHMAKRAWYDHQIGLPVKAGIALALNEINTMGFDSQDDIGIADLSYKAAREMFTNGAGTRNVLVMLGVGVDS